MLNGILNCFLFHWYSNGEEGYPETEVIHSSLFFCHKGQCTHVCMSMANWLLFFIDIDMNYKNKSNLFIQICYTNFIFSTCIKKGQKRKACAYELKFNLIASIYNDWICFTWRHRLNCRFKQLIKNLKKIMNKKIKWFLSYF